VINQIPKRKVKAIKLLTAFLDKKVLNRKLSFWLPFRAIQTELEANPSSNYYIRELKMDYGNKAYDKEQLEKELMTRFNKIEFNKVDNDMDSLQRAMDESNLFEGEFGKHNNFEPENISINLQTTMRKDTAEANWAN